MSTIVKDFVISSTEPKSTNLAWVEPAEEGYNLKIFLNGKWIDAICTKEPMEVTSMTTLTADQCDKLKPGDLIVKVTGTAKHCYRVSYKDETNGGMCITYVDAENVETVAYEKTEGVWEYLDTTITHIAQS